MSTLSAEMYFAKRLGDYGIRVFDGLTDTAQRKERIRQAIIARGCEDSIIGRLKTGKPETWSAAFERAFGEPLHPKTTLNAKGN